MFASDIYLIEAHPHVQTRMMIENELSAVSHFYLSVTLPL